MFVLNIKNAFVCMFLVFRLQVITRICPLSLWSWPIYYHLCWCLLP